MGLCRRVLACRYSRLLGFCSRSIAWPSQPFPSPTRQTTRPSAGQVPVASGCLSTSSSRQESFVHRVNTHLLLTLTAYHLLLPLPPSFLNNYNTAPLPSTHPSNPRHRHITALICVAVVRVHGLLARLPPHRDHARRQTHETADTTRTSNAALSRYTAHLTSAWHTSTHTPACASPVEAGACALRIGTSATLRRPVRLIRQLLR
jgi:hypothetical protein